MADQLLCSPENRVCKVSGVYTSAELFTFLSSIVYTLELSENQTNKYPFPPLFLK